MSNLDLRSLKNALESLQYEVRNMISNTVNIDNKDRKTYSAELLDSLFAQLKELIDNCSTKEQLEEILRLIQQISITLETKSDNIKIENNTIYLTSNDKQVGDSIVLPTIAGKSAYDIWLENGNVGTEQDFLDSLKGNDGEKGEDGSVGPMGPPGDPAQMIKDWGVLNENRLWYESDNIPQFPNVDSSRFKYWAIVTKKDDINKYLIFFETILLKKNSLNFLISASEEQYASLTYILDGDSWRDDLKGITSVLFIDYSEIEDSNFPIYSINGSEVYIPNRSRNVNEPITVQLKRGSNGSCEKYLGPIGEIIVDTTNETIRVQNGVLEGGILLAKKDHEHPEYDTDLSNYYTKQEVYNIEEVDLELSQKANVNHQHPEYEIDLSNYYTKPFVYNKDEIDDYLSLKADKDHEHPEYETDLSNYYTQQQTYNKSEVYNKNECNDLFMSSDRQYSEIEGETLNFEAKLQLIHRYSIKGKTENRDGELISIGQETNEIAVQNNSKIVRIKLPHPLRSTLDSSIYDELKDGYLIKRVEEEDGKIVVLEEEVKVNVYCNPFLLVEGNNNLFVLNELKTTMKFQYAPSTIGIFNKLDDDIANIMLRLDSIESRLTDPPVVDPEPPKTLQLNELLVMTHDHIDAQFQTETIPTEYDDSDLLDSEEKINNVTSIVIKVYNVLKEHIDNFPETTIDNNVDQLQLNIDNMKSLLIEHRS